jgi:predicted nuclease of predicted toxin-antitoxin system
VKLLLDHNISHKLVARLTDIFPGSTQTRLLNLGRTNDPQLWLIAKNHGYVFVTKDRDVAELAILRGAPPKVVWLRIGNCKTAIVELTLRSNFDAIANLAEDPEQVVLELSDQ